MQFETMTVKKDGRNGGKAVENYNSRRRTERGIIEKR